MKRKVAFFIEYSRTKKSNIVVTHPYTLLFVVAHPPKINELNTVVTATSDLDTPPPKKKKKRELERAQELVIDKQDLVKDKLYHFTGGEVLFLNFYVYCDIH